MTKCVSPRERRREAYASTVVRLSSSSDSANETGSVSSAWSRSRHSASASSFVSFRIFINGFLPHYSAYQTLAGVILLSPGHSRPPASAQQSAKLGRGDCASFFPAPLRPSTSPPPRCCRQSTLPERPSHGTPQP